MIPAYVVICDDTNNSAEDIENKSLNLDLIFDPAQWPHLDFVEVDDDAKA